MAFIPQPLINHFAEVAVFSRVSGVVVVESDPKACEVCLVVVGDPLNQRFRGNPFLLGPQHNGGAMGVVGTHVVALLATAFLETHPDISLDILK